MKTNRAMQKARDLRRQLGLWGQVDAEAVANILGMQVFPWQLDTLQELMVDDCICVAERLDSSWRRWVIAHAIGHKLLHPGNHLWMRSRTALASKLEREAEDFALGLLVDTDEATRAGVSSLWEAAEYFGVPEGLFSLQAQMAFEVTMPKDYEGV